MLSFLLIDSISGFVRIYLGITNPLFNIGYWIRGPMLIIFIFYSFMNNNYFILSENEKPQSVDILQKKVWGYSMDLETHTVETHVYRLRKKIKDKFNDENFITSHDKGYSI